MLPLAIHGGTLLSKGPALDGLFDTLSKKCKLEDLGNYILSDDKLSNYIIEQKQRKERFAFEKPKANSLKSIACYYSAGVMGKRKYQAVRLTSAMNYDKGKLRTAIHFMSKCPIPKLLPCNKLASMIKEIEEEFSSYVEEGEKISGCYRDLREYLPRLAQIYLSASARSKLKWFGKAEGSFQLAWGGDGCPFGKNESACSFLVSFVNSGKRVVSSSDNFLVFGANCQETSMVFKKYVLATCKQMADLQGKVFEINGLFVTFSFEDPNDMKMLAMLGGELSNSATYFSTFGNATLKNCHDVKGTFGSKLSCTWKAGSYQDRINTAVAVEKFKLTLEKKTVSSKNQAFQGDRAHCKKRRVAKNSHHWLES